MMERSNKLALVTGVSTGIGRELAFIAAEDGHDLLICANEAQIDGVAQELRAKNVEVTAVRADLATESGVDEMLAAANGRPIDFCLANAGRGLGHAFLNQKLSDAEDVIDVNVLGTTYLLHKIAKAMKDQGQGRILITGSIAGLMPGSFQAVYNATKAYIDTLSWGIRNELKDYGVSVTCLMPGPVDTEFFERADMTDTDVGSDPDKREPRKVARDGYDAMMKGSSGISSGFMTKIQTQLSGIVPESILASMHRDMAEPHDRKDQPGESR